ncbi:MAG TPA: ubiquinone/menaquinone biosynthesis methyltransferase [Verrucomicrobiae bacterium]|nr:ubiquinone/menaquinone biosynthesis methyltransferase [Verrucomicrobiae bacterium]
MTNGYYEAGPLRAQKVRQLFGRIAPRYDLLNDIQSLGLHRLWKSELVAATKLQPGASALDVCCGTGDIALRLRQRGARVTGCDFSPEMLTGAARRGSGIDWVQADALQLPFENGSFQVVTMAYGLRNLANLEGGVRELLRVLTPQGRLLILDFGKPKNRMLRSVYFTYLRLVVPLFGLLFCGDAGAYSYILESLLRYPAQEGVRLSLRNAGCGEVLVVNYLGGMMSLHVAEKQNSLREGGDVPLKSGSLVAQ